MMCSPTKHLPVLTGRPRQRRRHSPWNLKIDLLARAVAMDPIEFRLKNAVVEGDPMVNGWSFGKIGFKETLERVKEYLAEHAPPEGKNRGRGVAAGLWLTGCMGSAAHINVNADGSIALVIGSTDMSGTRTAFAQMVAEEFDVPLSDVTVVTGDTETAPFSIITAGSMTTRSMGKAVYRACRDVKEQICRRGAAKLGEERSEVEYAAGRVRLKKDTRKERSHHGPRQGGLPLSLCRAYHGNGRG